MNPRIKYLTVLAAAPLVGAAYGAFAQPAGTDSVPKKASDLVQSYVGPSLAFKEVNCAAAANTVVLNSTETANLYAVHFQNSNPGAANTVTVCLTSNCDDPSDGWTLQSVGAFVNGLKSLERSGRGAEFWCSAANATTGGVLEVLVEKSS